MNVLSFPFRFTSDGSAAVVEQFSDADIAQRIASLVQTEPSELPLAPHFGIPNPTFNKIRPSEIEAAILTFFPGVSVTSIQVGVDDDGKSLVDIIFNYSGGV